MTLRESVSAGNNSPINIIDPAQFGDYKTREEERCALGGISCGLEEEKLNVCSEKDAFRCTRIEESYLEKNIALNAARLLKWSSTRRPNNFKQHGTSYDDDLRTKNMQ